MAKVLGTGGAGFVGSHVADELTRVGHEVRIMDRRPSPYRHPAQKRCSEVRPIRRRRRPPSRDVS